MKVRGARNDLINRKTKMNYYEEALDICSKETDWKRLVFEIAKKHPKAVCVAQKSLIDKASPLVPKRVNITKA